MVGSAAGRVRRGERSFNVVHLRAQEAMGIASKRRSSPTLIICPSSHYTTFWMPDG